MKCAMKCVTKCIIGILSSSAYNRLMDRFTPEKRHEVMSKIRGKNTKPEIVVRKFLFSKGLRYRLHFKKLPGHPDIVLPKYKAAVFVHGCFWHRHENCKHFKMPKSNVDYWEHKITANVYRDRCDADRIVRLGWKVLVVWECELQKKTRQFVLDHLYHLIIDGVPGERS